LKLFLQKSKVRALARPLELTGSKSESNRLLVLKALYKDLNISNLSNADDTVLMQNALNSDDKIIDIHHAGTAMRFLTAYFSIQQGKTVVLTGSQRMKERPIEILVSALRALGAEIDYIEKEGFPPLKITGKALSHHQVSLAANVSSQYISALLLIAGELKEGLTINLKKELTSAPYLEMTMRLLSAIGVKVSKQDQTISVKPFNKYLKKTAIVVESDWSSASYFYSIVALSPVGTCIQLKSFKPKSLQADAALVEIYKAFGVDTQFNNHVITLEKVKSVQHDAELQLNLKNAPDIAQTIAVTAFGLGLSIYIEGLHTLKIKETDRLVALKTELEKLGAVVYITDTDLRLKASKHLNENVTISTYHDHRMAMAFAPLALKVPLYINHPDVVSKSYPDFWKDLEAIGFNLK